MCNKKASELKIIAKEKEIPYTKKYETIKEILLTENIKLL